MPASDSAWPRCIPRVCVANFSYLESINGTCECGFTRCTEYIYDEYVDHQCPEAPSGPFCGLIAYEDDFNETALLFEGDTPDSVPTIRELQVRFSHLSIT